MPGWRLTVWAASAVFCSSFLPPAASQGQVQCDNKVQCTDEAHKYLDLIYEEQARRWAERVSQTQWNYNVDISEGTADIADRVMGESAAFHKQQWLYYVSGFNLDLVTDPSLKRRLEMMSSLGTAALEEEQFAKLTSSISSMTSIYAAAKICPFDKPDCDPDTEGLTLEPGIEAIMAEPEKHSYEELAYVWQKWRDVSGKRMKEDYLTYVELSNKAAKANGYPDASYLWLRPYISDLAGRTDDPFNDFKQDLDDLWQTVKPFYETIHAYVRWKFSEQWGTDKVDLKKPIPAHITGNMWSQEWGNSYNLAIPNEGADSPLDKVTEHMVEQGYTPLRMFMTSDDFYKSLGLAEMSMCYTTPCGTEFNTLNLQCQTHNPMIVKPDWDVVCHASAWPMEDVNGTDYRIKMCTNVDFDDLVTVHHEMGHIQYFIQYKDQPIQFRDGANPGFHEAIGDTMALAVQTPAHLQSIGLLKSDYTDADADLNYLMHSAMDKVMFLPFGYLIDKYRWGVFDGSIKPEEMNKKWWEMREFYQGISPPVMRSEEDFDPAAKYHVAADVPYIRYFVARILQFQFYRQMCLDSNQYDPEDPSKPLFKCDFSNGEQAQAAGAKMKDLLMAGSSAPWPETLKAFTGTDKADASALVEYYQPLIDFLEAELKANDISKGWDSTFEEWFP